MKYSSLKVYLRDILKSSLITSIPEITRNKSWTKRMVKILVFLMCLFGFIYQTLNFLSLYLSYPTVVNVLISNPFEVTQPAVTICNRNRRRRTAVCAEDDMCYFSPSVKKYCDLYPRNCPSLYDDNTTFTGMLFVNELKQNSWYWEEEEVEAHNDSMIRTCMKVVDGQSRRCQKPYRQVPVVMAAGEPNMCYTIDSLWEKPDVEPVIYKNTFTIQLEIDTQPEEYIMHSDPVLIQVAVHDRRRLANPFKQGYILKGGTQYEATVTMTEKKLLPPPYDTNCTDYLKLWKENNGTGPLNDLMCVEYCKLRRLLEKSKCIDKDVVYPHMEDLCDRGELTVTSEIRENCIKSCGNPCSDYTYEVRYEEVGNYDYICLNDWCSVVIYHNGDLKKFFENLFMRTATIGYIPSEFGIKVSKVKMTFNFNQCRVTKFQYQPKFESVELFSYIGGYMGMWLGLSLVSLFDFLETIGYLFYYPLGHLRWKMKKQKTRPLDIKVYPYFRRQMY